MRFGAPPRPAPQAGAVEELPVEVENAGSVAWNEHVCLSYHWLDDRDNPIVWDGVRTSLPPLPPGERATVTARVRAPIPPGRYRLALDVVAEHRAWLSELGSPMQRVDVDVAPRSGSPHAVLPEWVEPAPDWHERVAGAHAEGYAVVAGAVAWDGWRRPRALADYAPGNGRVPGFGAPLLCPSVLPGVELERLDDVEGLPAFAAPPDEPWLYDGRIVVTVATARRRSGRRPS